ncbi:hypothetical protein FIBSPDRAFT_944004 [Athelia psychrophila]|uniref:DUF7729 domain-containing protein n=1 Tax=Athelia psychrophila TaxID=1759441 RepID=A0A166VT96_9AGAM|nr:hypothetical protein FIBSPDRAFT_944004 [Fibularhizoctonia sp. CBS 109695]
MSTWGGSTRTPRAGFRRMRSSGQTLKADSNTKAEPNGTKDKGKAGGTVITAIRIFAFSSPAAPTSVPFASRLRAGCRTRVPCSARGGTPSGRGAEHEGERKGEEEARCIGVPARKFDTRDLKWALDGKGTIFIDRDTFCCAFEVHEEAEVDVAGAGQLKLVPLSRHARRHHPGDKVPALPTPFPQPLDDTINANFNSMHCEAFFLHMAAAPTLRKCCPFSLLLQSSSEFADVCIYLYSSCPPSDRVTNCHVEAAQTPFPSYFYFYYADGRTGRRWAWRQMARGGQRQG